ATASRLNCSEYLDMVVDYLSFQPDWAGYQVSTKQGSGPINEWFKLCIRSWAYGSFDIPYVFKT
ncbi:hypothetical protein ABRP87_11105, partial [Corynebacterium sp. KPL2830]|uniref:hypothetical protein n=1 Tax=Corynebacterium sp. KPL2830 TaxID=3158315 RepID=UPI0032EFE81F